MVTGPQSAASLASAACCCLVVALFVMVFRQGLAPIDNVIDQGYDLVLGRPAVIYSRLEPSAFDAGDVEKMVSEWEVLAALGIPPDTEVTPVHQYILQHVKPNSSIYSYVQQLWCKTKYSTIYSVMRSITHKSCIHVHALISTRHFCTYLFLPRGWGRAGVRISAGWCSYCTRHFF